MFTALLILQVVLGLTIIGLVLLQQGKGADMGAAFGSGASGTVFGARGSGSFFSRATAIIAALFFVNSVLLSSPLILGDRHPTSAVTSSVVTEPEQPEEPAESTAGTPEEATDLTPSDLPEVDSEGTAAEMPAPADDMPAADMPEAATPADTGAEAASPAEKASGDSAPAAADDKSE